MLVCSVKVKQIARIAGYVWWFVVLKLNKFLE